MNRQHFEVAVEDAEGIESVSYDSRTVAVAAFAKKVPKLKPGQVATLNHVTVLDEAEGPE